MLTHSLTAGPASSFLVISEPQAAKHVLRATDNPKNPLYDKGLVREVMPSVNQPGFQLTFSIPRI